MNDSRKFLSVVIASGLDFDMLSPEDVLRHVTMEILAHNLPPDCIADLIEAALSAKVMSAELVLQTLGVETLAEHVPMAVLWACVSESALNSLGQSVLETKAKPRKAAAAAARVSRQAVAKAPVPAPVAVVAESEPEPEPAPEPEPEPAPLPATLAQAAPPARAPAPAIEPAPIPVPAANVPDTAMVARKPNRTVEPAATMEMQVTATTTSPMPVSPVEVEVVSSERMKTYADEDVDDVSYHDMDTSIGSLEPEIVEVEYGDENLSYSVDGDEVTAFGQE